MTQPCPECGGKGWTISSQPCKSNGTRRRRYACRACGHRWTTHDGPPPEPYCGGQRLSPEEVRHILCSTASLRQLSRELGRAIPTVSDAAQGRTYSHLFPDLPRRGGLSCLHCKHWRGECGRGFPDPEEDGLQAASWCNSYQPRCETEA